MNIENKTVKKRNKVLAVVLLIILLIVGGVWYMLMGKKIENAPSGVIMELQKIRGHLWFISHVPE